MVSEKQIADQLKKRMKELLPAKGLNFRLEIQPNVKEKWKPDFFARISFKGQKIGLAGKIISSPNYHVIRNKIAQIKAFVAEKKDMLPLLVSPFLSPEKRKECREAGVYYIDLSGNVYLEYGGLYVEREGFQNLFPEKRMGRNPFSDKASLILRAMLGEKERQWGVRELAQAVNLDPGFVSRMLRELENRGYVRRRDGKIGIRDPKSLLDDWVNTYDYRKNNELKFFCLAKGPDEILDKVRQAGLSGYVRYCLGFQAGANLIAPYAVYNEVHIYVRDDDSIDLFRKKLKLDEVKQGANLSLVLPFYKNSVFHSPQKMEGLWVVSDIQLYLDLYHYPLRGLEQAEHIYEKRLKNLIEG
jgi:hypothetical protein